MVNFVFFRNGKPLNWIIFFIILIFFNYFFVRFSIYDLVKKIYII